MIKVHRALFIPLLVFSFPACRHPVEPGLACIENAAATAPAPPGARAPAFFGYYGDGFAWLTPATAEVCEHVNISWVSSGRTTVGTLVGNLASARRLGLKVALAVPDSMFFDRDMTLAADFAGNWNEFAAAIRPFMDDVAFIYPIDEPYSQGKVSGVSAADVKLRLERVSALIKETFPSIPLAFSFSYIDFDTLQSAFADLPNPLPAGYDYFGFDCYGSWDACGDPAFRAVHPIPWYVGQIRARLTGTQKIFLFADAFVRKAKPTDNARDAAEAAALLTRADQYYDLALSDSSVIGLFGFLYQDDYVEGKQQFLGVKHWPALQARYVEIGRTITGKEFDAP